jgi:hypothetical protein
MQYNGQNTRLFIQIIACIPFSYVFSFQIISENNLSIVSSGVVAKEVIKRTSEVCSFQMPKNPRSGFMNFGGIMAKMALASTFWII